MPLAATWYPTEEFVQRLEDEIYRAVRYEVPFSVVVATLAWLNRAAHPTMEEFVSDGLRQIDFAGRLGQGSFAFALPFTSRRGAEVVSNRLRIRLIEFQPSVGFATAPDDGARPALLLQAAGENARLKAAI